MNGYCSDCGEEYELDALNLDLRCADCVEQWAIDGLEKERI
jgi:DNA-directed RNA polymerase subunit RPC12/RpoP